MNYKLNYLSEVYKVSGEVGRIFGTNGSFCAWLGSPNLYQNILVDRLISIRIREKDVKYQVANFSDNNPKSLHPELY